MMIWHEAAPWLAPGHVIAGKVRLDRVVGVGAMGVVFAGLHLDLEYQVAVKVLRPERWQDEEACARFRQEAQALCRINSEHVMRVYDVGTVEGGLAYIVMELLEGEDLAGHLRRCGRVLPEVAVGFILQACQALAESHALGILHRDLKPDNLFLTTRQDGTSVLKVLDFGLAKLQGDPHEGNFPMRMRALTVADRGLGTPHYMAPEQWLAAGTVGPTADIWSLGVNLYQMLTGALPFDEHRDADALLQSVLFEPLKPLAEHGVVLPPGLAEVVEACLRKEPTERIASVVELAIALVPFAAVPGRRSLTDALQPAVWARRLWSESPGESARPGVARPAKTVRCGPEGQSFEGGPLRTSRPAPASERVVPPPPPPPSVRAPQAPPPPPSVRAVQAPPPLPSARAVQAPLPATIADPPLSQRSSSLQARAVRPEPESHRVARTMPVLAHNAPERSTLPPISQDERQRAGAADGATGDDR